MWKVLAVKDKPQAWMQTSLHRIHDADILRFRALVTVAERMVRTLYGG